MTLDSNNDRSLKAALAIDGKDRILDAVLVASLIELGSTSASSNGVVVSLTSSIESILDILVDVAVLK